MKLTKVETFLRNAGQRNYQFLRLHTDNGLTGVREASLEWQEEAVRSPSHEFLEDRYILSANPFDIESLIVRMGRALVQTLPFRGMEAAQSLTAAASPSGRQIAIG